MAEKRFPCGQCGAEVEFQPGAAALRCAHCGFENPIPEGGGTVEELDYEGTLAELESRQETHVALAVKCQGCGAETTLPENVTAAECPFCGLNVVATARATTTIKPRSLLPFKVAREQALGAFRRWLHGLWFAPGKLKREALAESRLTGLYVPYWTYDSATTSRYRGERGDDYWVSVGHGKSRRRVRKTRWSGVSGTVAQRFDDLLVLASRSLPPKHAEKLEPWDLGDLVPYGDEYLSGFRAESYQVGLRHGFARARAIMDERIRELVRRDIGGDHQRIHAVNTRYEEITFKHLLLPVWLSAYRFRERLYRFLVNARTGEVQGERPWSLWKIALAALLALAAAGGAAAFMASR